MTLSNSQPIAAQITPESPINSILQLGIALQFRQSSLLILANTLIAVAVSRGDRGFPDRCYSNPI